MLGLPKATELNKQLPKKAIYAKFQMNTAERERMDRDISKITIVNEISPAKINLGEGEKIKSFFVLLVTLKRKEFEEKNILKLSKLIPQNILFVLEYEGEAVLAVYETRLISTPWQKKDGLSVELKGLELDAVWQNIIQSMEGGEWKEELSLDENLLLHEKREKLQKEIARLEKQARAEKQPRKKFELVQKVKKLRKQLEKDL